LQAVLRIRITLMRIQMQMRKLDPLSLCECADPDPACHFVADPDPTFHFNADPDPSFQIQNKNIEKVLK
jgi:hypothetical protein